VPKAKRYGRVQSPKGHHFTPRPPKKTRVKIKNVDGKKIARTVYDYGDGKQGLVRVGPEEIKIITGKMDFSTWSDEELIRGAKGKKRRPSIIPAEVHQELARRIVNRIQHQFFAELAYAVKEHFKMIKDTTGLVPPQVKLRAIEMLYDRVLGKPKENVTLELGGEMAAWQKLVAEAIVPSIEQIKELQGRDDVVDGEIVEDEEDEA